LGKLKVRFTWLAIGFALSSSLLLSCWAQGSSEVHFVDSCTGELTATASSQGFSVVVDVKGLSPDFPVIVDLQVGPDHLFNVRNHFAVTRVKKTTYPHADGTFFLKKKIKLGKIAKAEGDPPVGKIWVARLSWAQNRRGQLTSQLAWASIYVMSDDSQKFYERLGDPVSRWFSPVVIASEYHRNLSSMALNFSRELDWKETFGGSATFDLGAAPDLSSNVASRGPLMATEWGSAAGWFFRGWRAMRQDAVEVGVVRKWTLEQDQGGFFGTRTSFVRLPVQEYVLRPKKGWFDCSRWEKSTQGLLDIGKPELDFYIVPSSYATSYESAESYLNRQSPSSHFKPQLEYQVSGSGDELLFFYPHGVLQTH